jgi:ribonucleoside-diphosphate reductase alpha chain
MKLTRPTRVESETTFIETSSCGELRITVGLFNNKPIEVFMGLGDSGCCSACQNEALARSISLGLKCGVPVGEYADQLRGIRCPSPKMFPKTERILSCSDALSSILSKYCEKVL